MKLSISNIAWEASNDSEVYKLMQLSGFSGIEIAPSRLLPENPYDHLNEAEALIEQIKTQYGLTICSMQSIWYGLTERIAGSDLEYYTLINYTKKAICFAKAIKCNNLVFGCPKNRTVKNKQENKRVKRFLGEIADYAYENGIIIALEANPVIYNTNFANRTDEAIQVIRELNSPGLKLNLDFGTIIENGESVRMLENDVDVIHHVHISEPYLKLIRRRKEHIELRSVLEDKGYSGYVSVEMKAVGDLSLLKQTLYYMKEVFD